ncbi:MAG: FAD-dependent oxidoreductase [Nocardiaceae bacterium]|nr:FAD-dependent oxidoreductase [Nocardiaceae bacterium]
MTSLWLDRPPISLPSNENLASEYDCVVVGAGLTGLATALLLAQGGLTVAVLEARTIGAVATGNTTGKVSLLQGTHLSAISAKHSSSTVHRYVEANRAAQQWLLGFCADHGIDTQHAAAVTYAGTPDGSQTVQREFRACREAGLDVEWSNDAGLPYRSHGAVRLAGQAQFDPMDVLEALAMQAAKLGASIFEHTRVHGVHGREVATTRGTFHARTVILATGTPILDRGGYFARLEPKRSYAVAFEVPGDFPHDMYLSADEPSRSLRYTPRGGRDLLLVGGNGHAVGRSTPTQPRVDDLAAWTTTHFPGAEPTHQWSAQDYSAIDELPYVGPLLPGNDHVLVATGYAKWGMTNGVAAALALTGSILGTSPPWADVFGTWRGSQLGGLPKAAVMNAQVGRYLTAGWLRAIAHRTGGEKPAEGEGRVERRGVRPVGVCTVDGHTSTVSAVCPHLYGVLNWNNAERSWDCPLHGSRFSHDGKLLEGPATADLKKLEA